MKPHFLSLFLLIFATTILAQDNVPVLKPIAELPETVKTTDGEIGVFVDWNADENGHVTTFVVNRTHKAAEFKHAYGSVYLKLEAQNSDGVWERTEFHIDEMCGTGLGNFVLKPGHWLKQVHSIRTSAPIQVDAEAIQKEIRDTKDFMSRARLTKKAYDEHIARIEQLETQLEQAEADLWEERTVRLRIYDRHSQAFSNSGSAFVNLNGIEQSKGDVYAIRFANTERLRTILSGEEEFTPAKFPFGVPMHPKHTALFALVTHNHAIEDATDIINSVIANEKDAATVELAKQLLTELKMKFK